MDCHCFAKPTLRQTAAQAVLALALKKRETAIVGMRRKRRGGGQAFSSNFPFPRENIFPFLSPLSTFSSPAKVRLQERGRRFEKENDDDTTFTKILLRKVSHLSMSACDYLRRS